MSPRRRIPVPMIIAITAVLAICFGAVVAELGRKDHGRPAEHASEAQQHDAELERQTTITLTANENDKTLVLANAALRTLEAATEEVNRWQTTVVPLLENPQGLAIASDAERLHAFRQLYDTKLPDSDEIAAARRRVEQLKADVERVLRDRDAAYTATKQREAIEAESREAAQVVQAYRERREKIEALLRQAKSSSGAGVHGEPKTLAGAMQAQIDSEQQVPRYDGVYRRVLGYESSRSPSGPDKILWSEYLRFYPNGSLIETISMRDPDDLRKWFAPDIDPDLFVCGYTRDGTRLSWSITVGREIVRYTADADIKSLHVESYNPTTSERHSDRYAFVGW